MQGKKLYTLRQTKVEQTELDEQEDEGQETPHSIYYSSSNTNLLNHHQHGDDVISPTSPNLPPITIDQQRYSINNNSSRILSNSPSGQVDFLSSVHSGPTIDSINMEDEPQELVDVETSAISRVESLPESKLEKAWNFFKKNIIAHGLIWINLTLFSGFLILSPYGIKIFNPIVFSFFRGFALVFTLFPIMLLVDRKFRFKTETDMIKRAWKFRKTHPTIYGSWYFGWIYSLFYDEKSLISAFVLPRIPNFKQAKLLCWCGMLAVINQLLFVAGLNLTGSTVTGVMQPLVAIIVCVISMVIGRESKSFVKLMGSVVAVLGAISMLVASAVTKDPVKGHVMEPDTFDNLSPFERLPEYFSMLADVIPSKLAFIFGLLCLFGNTFSYSIYLVLQKTLLDKGVPALTVTFWSFFFGLSVSFLSSLYFFPTFNYRRIDLKSVLSVLYAAIPYGALQFSFSAQATRMLTPTLVAVYSTISPMVAILTGILAFGESPSPWILVGAFFILVGVFIVIGYRYVETRQNVKAAAQKANTEMNSVEDTGNDLVEPSSVDSSKSMFASSANLDVTPSSLSNFQFKEEEEEEDTPNFKSL